MLVNGHFVAVEKATTTQHWKEGLSGLAKPRRSGGMFFVFDRRIKPVFWMSGMQFAIDAVWVREGVVLQVMANLQPPQPGRPAMEFSPDQPVDAVWELPAGMAEELCIQPGSRIYSMNPFGR